MSEQARQLANILSDRYPEEDDGRLLLFGIRRVAAGGLNDAHAANAYLAAFGLAYRRPLILLRALMAELSRVSRRRIMIAPCCCPRTTSAEANILEAVVNAVEAPHDAHRLLCETLDVENCLGALSSAQALGQAFADLGHPLAS
jgi:hypothetical protein